MEVVLAVGVISFAFVAILGLLPAGLTQFRQAVDNSVCAQIAQRVIMDAQQTDFDTLIDTATYSPNWPTYFPAKSTTKSGSIIYQRYFDEQGNEIVPLGSAPSATEQAAIVYYVNTRIGPRVAAVPGVGSNGTGGTPGIASVLVQVAFNPGNRALNTDGNSLLNVANMPGVTVRNYSAQIGRGF